MCHLCITLWCFLLCNVLRMLLKEVQHCHLEDNKNTWKVGRAGEMIELEILVINLAAHSSNTYFLCL